MLTPGAAHMHVSQTGGPPPPWSSQPSVQRRSAQVASGSAMTANAPVALPTIRNSIYSAAMCATRTRARSAGDDYRRAGGIVKKNVAPCPTSASAQTRPPCRSITR